MTGVPDPPGKRQRSARGGGNALAEEILRAATELLIETDNSEAVSIRAVAKRVGVTPPSIYLHFADKDALLTAVVARYLTQLDDALRLAEAGAATAWDAAREQGLEFVRFALRTPELYRLAVMAPAEEASAVDVVLGAAAFGNLEETVRRLQTDGYYPPGDPRPIALRMLTVVHGVASLLVAKPFLPWGDPIEYADRVINGACLGMAVTAWLDRPLDSAESMAIIRVVAPRANPDSEPSA